MPQASDSTPKINPMLLNGFHWYIPRYLRKHFHSLAIHLEPLQSAAIVPSDAIVVYANHASWWDPLVALFLCKEVFPDFRFYAPIDADALKKYKIFSNFGFFPVQLHHLAGARNFLTTSYELLKQPKSSIWITPEGRFADTRDHSADLMPGLSHLAHHVAQSQAGGPSHVRVWFIPAAIEYTFWEERLPEILVWFGVPICPSSQAQVSNTKAAWHQLLSEGLRSAQRELAAQCVARNSDAFHVALSGKAGTSVVYDTWRRCYGRLFGTGVSMEHGEKLRGNK